MDKRYYIGEIDIRNGEYEHKAIVRFVLEEEFPAAHLKKIASEFYGEPDEAQDSDSEGYYFHGGQVYCEAGSVKSIGEATFKDLEFIITEM